MNSLLVFGLDGATFNVLLPYARSRPDGALSRLLQTGLVRVLRSTVPAFTAPAWTTFMTGLRPDQHGVYHWRGRFDRHRGTRPLRSSSHLESATLWSYCQSNGGRISVTNFPMQYPAPPTAGVYICGTLAPEGSKSTSWPRELTTDLLAAFPNYRYEMDKGLSYIDRPAELRDHIMAVGRDHSAALLRFGCVRDADLLVHVATMIDRMQHFFWHYHDPTSLPHAPARVESLGNPVFDAYEEADRLLGTLLASRRWSNVMVLSDHGAGPSEIAFHTDVWLAQQGCLSWDDQRRVNVPACVAYSGEEPECSIYINRQDRDGFGVTTGDYARTVNSLKNGLQSLRRPFTETPLFEDVVTTAHRAGRFSDVGPDLVLLPAEGVHPRPGWSANVFDRDTRLVGGHRRDGVFIGYGDAFVMPSPELQIPLDMIDIFPLACVLLKLPIPAGLSGIVHKSLLKSGWTAAIDERTDWPSIVEEPTFQGDLPSMTARLMELGYL